MSPDEAIKANIDCPKCQEKMTWDQETKVFCKCGFSKGHFDHVHFITEKIAVGNEIAPVDDQLLRLCGIDFVLTVAADFDQMDDISVRSAKVGLSDSGAEQKDLFLQAVKKLQVEVDDGNTVLVHCMGGSRRSVAVAAYLLSDGDEAKYWQIITDFKQVRRAVNPVGGIHTFIERYLFASPDDEPLNCLFLSCHASLEYYMSLVFQKIGIGCPLSDMDLGNSERPFIKDYRENNNQQSETNRKHWNQEWVQDDFKGIDFIYMMNFGNVDDQVEYYAQFKLPIFVHLFGQYNIRLVHRLIELGIKYANIFLVCYSKTELGIYRKLSFDHRGFADRIYHVPFALSPAEFGAWSGGEPKVYTTCNDFQNRPSCNFPVYQKIIAALPAVFSGRNTEEVGGLGLQDYHQLKHNYQTYRAYLSMGTVPAPYTLTPLEAMMTGCPTVIYDNGMGIADEGILSSDGTVGLVSSNVETIQKYLGRVLDDAEFANEQSIKVRDRALDLFHIDKIAPEWKQLLTKNI